MRVLLVLPNVYTKNRVLDQDCKEPLGVLYLTSVLRRSGHHVDILDAGHYGLSVEQTAMVIQEAKPQVVGFSVVQRSVLTALAVTQRLREGQTAVHVCFGGYFPTLAANEMGHALRGLIVL